MDLMEHVFMIVPTDIMVTNVIQNAAQPVKHLAARETLDNAWMTVWKDLKNLEQTVLKVSQMSQF